MDRRQFQHSSLISFIMLVAGARSAHAISLNDLSGADASTGLKAALEKGALSAVGLLGVANGVSNNDWMCAALLAAIAHDFMHLGGVNQVVSQMEKQTCEQLRPILEEVEVQRPLH